MDLENIDFSRPKLPITSLVFALRLSLALMTLLFATACRSDGSTPERDREATDARTDSVPTEKSATPAVDNFRSEATDTPTTPASDNSRSNATGAPATPVVTLVATESARVDRPESVPSSSGSFASVSAGVFHTCGVRTDGAVECWGSNEDGG